MNRLFYFCTMEIKRVKRNLVLAILFFLPVAFLLFLYPAQHHYNPLDMIKGNVKEITGFSHNQEGIALNDHITVLGFAGKKPMEQSTALSNVKELVYDKFKGFKRFQVVIVVPKGSEQETEMLQKAISSYEDLKFWHFVFLDEENIQKLYDSLESDSPLTANLASNNIYIIDKELNQRGRIDDRSDAEIAKKKPIYRLVDYNSVEVAVIKNKMSEDMRILFTEYRQKRKGTFDSTTRRENSLKANITDEEN